VEADVDGYQGLDDLQLGLTSQAQARQRLFGVYPALVQSIADPDQQGRVRVRLPWAPDGSGAGYEAWARLATLMAGADRGVWFIPDVGEEVLVAFEGGDPRRPYVIGALWNGVDAPPEQMDSGEQNNKKVIVSRNNLRITLDDAQGQETVTIETPGGQVLTLKDGPGQVKIDDSNGNNLTMESAGITLSTAGKLTIQASTINVTAGMVSVDAGMSKFSGVVKSDTVITNAVVSASYTPGAGNIW
jgi:uncharacterized protein involved in type VI secretion and phage assembly